MRNGKWSGNRLKQAISKIDESGFWGSTLGVDLTRQVAEHLSPTVTRVIHRELSFDVNDVEVTHTVMSMVTANPAAKKGLRESDDPWAYLYRCAERWMRQQAGHRATGLEVLMELAAPDVVHEGMDPSHGLTPLARMVALTVSVLTPLVEYHREELAKAVYWFATNPETHQGHGLSEAQRDRFLHEELGLDSRQIAAIANIAWGARPERSKSSLFAGFLMDPDFDPINSFTHRRALAKFRAEFAKAGN